MAVLVGCCGFALPQRRYVREFPLVEVQQTFYHPPRLATAQRWRQEAGASFVFTLKAWQLITHPASSPTYRRLRQPLGEKQRFRVGFFQNTDEVWQAWETTRQIATVLRAAVVVFQCPASFTPTATHQRHLRRFFQRVRETGMPAGDPLPLLGWEPRGHWPRDVVAAICQELDLVHVVDPFQGLPVRPGVFYFRLHGIGGYRHVYGDAELDQLAAWLAACGGEGYCLFNNATMRDDARRLLARLRRAEPPSAR
jgi:uncharacterized protein YecE (DUF72 family)